MLFKYCYNLVNQVLLLNLKTSYSYQNYKLIRYLPNSKRTTYLKLNNVYRLYSSLI